MKPVFVNVVLVVDTAMLRFHENVVVIRFETGTANAAV